MAQAEAATMAPAEVAMTSGRPAARTRNVTGAIAVASFVGIVAAFQIGANTDATGTLSTSKGAPITPTATPTATAAAAPTAAPVAAPTTTTVTHSTTATKPAPAPVAAAPAPAPAPAPAAPPVAKTKPSGGG